MRVKLFEVRDEGTFIPVVAVEMFPSIGNWWDTMRPQDLYGAQKFLLHRAGYQCERLEEPAVVLFRASGNGEALCNPADWGNRTMRVAHEYIQANFARLPDCAVIDVQYILHETTEPKVSQRPVDPSSRPTLP